MKVFTLTLLTVLLIGASSAAKIRRGEKRAAVEETKPAETEDATKAEITEADTDKKEKEVHKRGIFHHGGALAAPVSLWPKTYAAHYGYGLRLPASSGFSVAPLAAASGHLHGPAVLKYNSGFHYKTLAAPSLLSGVSSLAGVSGLSAAYPTYASLSPAVSHVHQAASAQPFIIRPGGAVVQSYSVTYPHHKAAVAVKPVHAFAAAAPVQPAIAVQPAVQHVQPAVAAVQPVHTFQTVAQHLHPVQPVQPVQPVAAVQPVQPVAAVQPVHHLQPVQPVQHLHPVPPVQSVVQVQHFKPPVHYDVTQQFPSFFQTSFVQPAPVPAIPQNPAVAFGPAQPNFPAIPTFPNPPAFPTIPSVPAQPAVPAVPATPTIPTIPSIPNFPQPQVPTNGFFPVNVQPPLQQQPPAFNGVHPQAQFPGFGPIAGNNPDAGSAEAAPQIPVQPEPSPEPELPPTQPQPTQQPWKPVLYQPPTVESHVNRPSHTLLPPYGNSPAEGYLPPAPSSQNAKLQQEYTIDSSLFDNLSDADIQNIFAQASLAAHRDHHHHTVHNYHTRF
ncbi:vegetative cell wall protein gp1 isoform X1 [Lucilia cuprina]|uniref:vegetative cell wall protein gp1 isoform X1 n=1 Tax=Lucilia cuprina TaxID=7375 RepID=UPI001F058C3C|nr:vegetative cell wall protein gp1 isoform X1 [Lucilia cuprina]